MREPSHTINKIKAMWFKQILFHIYDRVKRGSYTLVSYERVLKNEDIIKTCKCLQKKKNYIEDLIINFNLIEYDVIHL